MTTDPAQLVGQRLRTLRAEHGLTVRGLAEISGLAFNTISLIERGKLSPTVSTLHKLSMALHVPLASFVSDAPPRQVVYSKARTRQRAHSGGALLEDLGLGLPNQSLQFLLITLPPGASSGPDPIVHAGHEFAFCLEGRIEYQIDGARYLLEPEDTLLFEASLPHCWRNGEGSQSRLVVVFQSADGHDGPHSHVEGAEPDRGGLSDASGIGPDPGPDPRLDPN